MNRYDLVIVGGGVSGSLTLLHLVREMESSGDRRPRRIAVVDRAGDFGTGVPYGRLAHPLRLLNETGATMEMHGFAEWLVSHREDWMGGLRSADPPGFAEWLQFNSEALARGKTDARALAPVYLPRSAFGSFLEGLFAATLAQAARLRTVVIDRVMDEAIAIHREEDGALRLELRDGALEAPAVILGLGSLPPDPEPGVAGRGEYVADPSARSVEDLRRVFLENMDAGPGGRGRLVVLGLNAAAMELFHFIAYEPGMTERIEEICVVSTNGRVPDSRPSDQAPLFVATRLAKLARDGAGTARDLAEAAQDDDARGRENGHTSLDRLGPMSSALGEVLATLGPAERRLFVEEHGMAFTAGNYHTPPEYADAAARLVERAGLRHVPGRVGRVEWEGRPVVHLRAALEGADRLEADVVVDCRGAGRVDGSAMPLLRSLLDPVNGLAVPSANARGIRVDSDFAAGPGIWVMGPLLAGHVSETDCIWHLESAPRIDPLAARLAATISRFWGTGGKG